MKFVGSGCYGKYYQVNDKIGFKTMHGHGMYDTIEEAKKSHEFIELNKEFLKLNKAYKRLPKIICKPDGIRFFRVEDKLAGLYRYVVGLQMEHLGELTLSAKTKQNWRLKDTVLSRLADKLRAAGIEHPDLHGGNVMYYKNKYKVIDAGLIEFIRKGK